MNGRMRGMSLLWKRRKKLLKSSRRKIVGGQRGQEEGASGESTWLSEGKVEEVKDKE